MSKIPVSKGGGSIWTGWVKPITDVLDQLEADIEGLKLRLKYPTRPGVPAAYQASKVFLPETRSFLLDTAQNGISSNLVNFVVRDGTTYDIPIQMPGPGVFALKRMKVVVFQRLFETQYRAALELPMVVGTQPFIDAFFTTKFSLFPVQPVHRIGPPVKVGTPSINFFWNLLEGKSQRKLSEELLPSMCLLPRSHMFSSTNTPPWLHDGGLFEFDVPWLMERDAQLNFQFRPINPVLQFDSTIAGTDAAIGLAFDDRENGVRNQQVRVSVELHGYRYETEQDALRMGATTR